MPRGRRLYRQSFDTPRREGGTVPHRFQVWLQLSGIEARLQGVLWDALCRAKQPTAQQIWWFFERLETRPITSISHQLMLHVQHCPPAQWIHLLEGLVTTGHLSRPDGNALIEAFLACINAHGEWKQGGPILLQQLWYTIEPLHGLLPPHHALEVRMSQGSPRPHPQELVFSLRMTPQVAGDLVQLLLGAVRSLQHGPGQPAEAVVQAADTDEEDPAPRPESTADPPATRNGHAPVLHHGVELPPELAGRYVLGNVCGRGHDYQGIGQGVRKKSNGGCKQCQDGQVRKSMPPAHRNGHTDTAPQTRPALPDHLRESCFLSPITCEVATHRYRDSAYTLRFRDTEACCQCVAQTAPSLGGD